MNIHAEKLELMKLILETKNLNLLSILKNILQKSKEKDFWETLTEEEKNEILSSIEEINKGELINYNEFIRTHK